MFQKRDEGFDFGDLFRLVFIIIALLGPALLKLFRKARGTEQPPRGEGESEPAESLPEERAEEEPEPEEERKGPYLPYEDVAEEIFGGYIAQKKKEYEEAKLARERAERVVVPVATERPVTVEFSSLRPVVPESPVSEESEKPSPPLPRAPVVAPRKAATAWPGRNLPVAAQAFLYSEIFGPCRARRVR